MFDVRSPAPGVHVCPVPRARLCGLNAGQRRGMRKLSSDQSVLRAKPLVQPIKTRGGGVPPSLVTPCGDTRSNNHRRRSPKPRSKNPCFHAAIPTPRQSVARDIDLDLARMQNIYRKLVRVAQPALDQVYESLRKRFYRLHRESFWKVREMEIKTERENRARK